MGGKDGFSCCLSAGDAALPLASLLESWLLCEKWKEILLRWRNRKTYKFQPTASNMNKILIASLILLNTVFLISAPQVTSLHVKHNFHNEDRLSYKFSFVQIKVGGVTFIKPF